ncbi:CPBP family intramembrane glutamic endopeptidase [Paenibacillus sp. YYML68]|uniref:CPBP family intramembrane glutamic endopeptidase n=1 Tax=Paenibacillus sp. YYML68 TaxID=2909250 RepID=UPI00248FECC7|nr:CPBP family intramembrane glutamic endopeptidase [Paenibacillus sp. YYML68]
MVLLHALFLYLLAVEPVLGYRKYETFKQVVQTDSSARMKYYRFVLLMLWGLTAYLMLAAWLTGELPGLLELQLKLELDRTGAVLLGALLIGTVVPVVLALVSKAFRHTMSRQLAGVEPFLPKTQPERLYWVWISLSAGICEELLYRVFLFHYLASLGLEPFGWSVIIISAVIFGLGHTYQGVQGVATTALVGAVLGSLYALTGSIWPAMIIHFLMDVRILAFLPRHSSE